MPFTGLNTTRNQFHGCDTVSLCIINIRLDGTMVNFFTAMDSGQVKKNDLVTRSNDGLESRVMDICHSNSNDIYSTTTLDILIENLQKLQLDIHNLERSDERPRSEPEKDRDGYGIPEQKIREFHITIPKLKEENEIPQNRRIGESGQIMNSQ